MKYLEEYRDAEVILRLAEQIRAAATRPWRIMEICGGQTNSILRAGLLQLLPSSLELIHGPGCPVCVTPERCIDQAISIAFRQDAVLCTFGDMLRVPGSDQSLLGARAAGGHVQMVTSPLDALQLAIREPSKQVVFFAVGFETTAPTTAVALKRAQVTGVENFRVLLAHVRVPPALEALLGEEGRAIDGLLAAGHVCTVMGTRQYDSVAERFELPIVVTGFEPVDILRGVLRCVQMLEQGEHRVENEYRRVVNTEGNPVAQALVDEVFEVVDLPWRGLGTIVEGGLRLRSAFASYDAARLVAEPALSADGPERAARATLCKSGLVLAGKIRPTECPAFGKQCTPRSPLGAPMVSSEGACAAYFKHAPKGDAAQP